MKPSADNIASSHEAATFPPYDVLVLIFERLDVRTCTNVATVCQIWSQLALKEIWKVHHDVCTVFQQLAPLVLDADGKYSFTRQIGAEDWGRFLPFANRIRSVTMNQWNMQLSESAIREITTSNPSQFVLPQLQEFYTTGSSSLSHSTEITRLQNAIFLCPTIIRLSLAFKYVPSDSVSLYLEGITLASGLERLCVYGFFNSPNKIPIVIDALSSLRTLQSIEFDAPEQVAQMILHSVSALPSIREIILEELDNPTSFRYPSATSAKQDPFRSLRSLQARLCLNPSAQTLFSLNHFVQLRSLDLHVQLGADSSEIPSTGLSSAIASVCPQLTSLSLDFDSQNYYEENMTYVITIALIQPLLRISSLRSFILGHHMPLYLSGLDYVNIARAWGKTIETLMLNPSPRRHWAGVFSLDGLEIQDLQCLIPIATHCSQIRQFGTMLRSGVQLAEQLDSNATTTPQAYFSESLRSFDFGSCSPPASPWATAAYLKSLVGFAGIPPSLSGRGGWAIVNDILRLGIPSSKSVDTASCEVTASQGSKDLDEVDLVPLL